MKVQSLAAVVAVAYSGIAIGAVGFSGIYVEQYSFIDGWQTVPGFTPPIGPGSGPGRPSGSSISFTANAGGYYRIWAVNENVDDIGSITINGSASNSATVFVGYATSPFAGSIGETSAACDNLGSFFSSPKVELIGRITGELTGQMTAYDIHRFDFGTASSSSGNGVISGDITHNPSADASVGPMKIFAKTVESTSSIKSFTSDIANVQVYGEFAGSVSTANGGDLILFSCQDYEGGDIDVSGDIVDLAVTRYSRGSIHTDGDFILGFFNRGWGVIDTPTPSYLSSSITVDGSVDSLEVGGDYVGELQAGSIESVLVEGGFYDYVGGVVVDGLITVDADIELLTIGEPAVGSATGSYFDLDADSITGSVTIGGDYSSGIFSLNDGLPNGTLIRIGGALLSAAQVRMNFLSSDTNDVGLAGLVVVNANNDSSTWATNSVQVITDSGTILPYGNYTTLSSEFGMGSGAVGLPPFNFHQRTSDPASGLITDRNCNPFHTEQYTVSPLVGLSQVVISHYGPVYANGTGNHFYVEFKSDIFPSTGSPQWIDVSSQFEVISSNVDDGSAQRDIVIAPISTNKTGFEASGQWRITPVMDKVKCGSVAGSPNVVYDSSVVSGLLGNTTSGTQYDWYVFRVRQQPLLGLTVLDSGTGPSLNDVSTWLTNPYEVNADGETNTQDFIDLTNELNNN